MSGVFKKSQSQGIETDLWNILENKCDFILAWSDMFRPNLIGKVFHQLNKIYKRNLIHSIVHYSKLKLTR